jgi:tRNA pseudouridine55 synthase
MMARVERRSLDGILLLDKPMGLSSNAALQKVRYLLRAKKGGHTGSLDPLATGLLPLCFGEATKVSGFLLDADKRYRVKIRLGTTTSTGDGEGEVLETRAFEHITQTDVEQALERFRGEIQQIPPMHSALKHQGQRLYKLARQGVEVERPPRTVTIHELTLLAVQPGVVELDVHCSKGTYVRTLAEDLGEVLGTGGHVEALRRTGLGPFDAERMLTLSQLEAMVTEGAPLEAELLPVDSALADWPEISLGADAAFYFSQGQAVFVPQTPIADWLRVYGPGRRFIGMARIQYDGRVAPKRLLSSPACSSKKTAGRIVS